MEKSESNITAVTSNEIGKRMSLYQQEEDRLDRIITKRLQAGYSLGVTSSSNVVNNTITHAPNISVNATSTQNIDVNTLANRMIKKVENYYKGINN